MEAAVSKSHFQHAVLQIRRGKSDNLGINFHISSLKHIFDPSLKPSCRDGYNEGSQHMFLLSNKENLSLNDPQHPV